MDKQYHEDYTGLVKNIMKKVYAEKSVKQVELDKTWFIPSKPSKIFVVFNYSIECCGVSPNKSIISGHNLTIQLVSTVNRFREDFVAVIADIEAIFY